ncbi:MAG: pseudaminic acid synthase [Acidimicrobiales bacterium]|jgi:N-acetylneuraminate synthase|nr:pseudaminic acid synthase [Acidimicrobiales bacterium]
MSSTIDPVLIGGRPVGPGHPVYVIAEISANHNQELEQARRLVAVAADAGADAVKLQTYTPDTLTIDSDEAPFRIGGGTLWDGRTLYDLYGEAFTPWEWHEPLRDEAQRFGIQCLSSPFDATAVALLDDLGLPALKIASFELVDLELIACAAATGRPLIISTGMASVAEIDAAVATARANGDGGVVLLRCNSAYPAPAGEMDLRTIPDMVSRWGCPVGLSDHTLGNAAAIAAVALGACVVEKHVTLTRSEPGPDSAFSLEPAELAALVRDLREAEAAIGAVRYGPTEREQASLAFRRSIFAVADIAEGEPFTRANVRVIRPGHGLAPVHLPEVLDARAAVAIRRGTPLAWELVRS